MSRVRPRNEGLEMGFLCIGRPLLLHTLGREFADLTPLFRRGAVPKVVSILPILGVGFITFFLCTLSALSCLSDTE